MLPSVGVNSICGDSEDIPHMVANDAAIIVAIEGECDCDIIRSCIAIRCMMKPVQRTGILTISVIDACKAVSLDIIRLFNGVTTPCSRNRHYNIP